MHITATQLEDATDAANLDIEDVRTNSPAVDDARVNNKEAHMYVRNTYLNILAHSATPDQARAWESGFTMGRDHASKAPAKDAGEIAFDGFCDYVEYTRDAAGRKFPFAVQGWFHEGYDAGWEANDTTTQ